MLDKIDRQILNLLQEDARISNKELSNRIGLVPSATSERLRKLKENGVIEKFEARLNAARLDHGLLAFIFVRTNEIASGSEAGEELARIPEVQEVYNVAGEDCYFLKVRTRTTKTLSHLLKKKIGAIDSVESTRTTIVMESYKETCAIPIDIEN